MKKIILLISLIALLGCSSKTPEELIGKWERQERPDRQIGIQFYEDGSAEMLRVVKFDNKVFRSDLIGDSLKKEISIYNPNISRENIKYRTFGRKDSMVLILDFYKVKTDTPFYSFPLGIIKIQSPNEFWLYENEWRGEQIERVLKTVQLQPMLESVYMYNTDRKKNLNQYLPEDPSKIPYSFKETVLNNSSLKLDNLLDDLHLTSEEKDIYDNTDKYIDSLMIIKSVKKYGNTKNISIEKIFNAIDLDRKYRQDRIRDFTANYSLTRFDNLLNELNNLWTDNRKLSAIQMIEYTNESDLTFIKKFLLRGGARMGSAILDYYHDYNNLNALIFDNNVSPKHEIFRKGL